MPGVNLWPRLELNLFPDSGHVVLLLGPFALVIFSGLRTAPALLPAVFFGFGVLSP